MTGPLATLPTLALLVLISLPALTACAADPASRPCPAPADGVAWRERPVRDGTTAVLDLSAAPPEELRARLVAAIDAGEFVLARSCREVLLSRMSTAPLGTEERRAIRLALQRYDASCSAPTSAPGR
ncbi:MAG: hypothetical protein IT457_10145 [Planctomycetes bacterium]|nr:hypothetical protein [Planctomycetota bacterium]